MKPPRKHYTLAEKPLTDKEKRFIENHTIMKPTGIAQILNISIQRVRRYREQIAVKTEAEQV